jgi:hypothetical protein
MALTAAVSPNSFPQSSMGRFNAEPIFMQTPLFTEPIADHFGFISLRIIEADFSSAISFGGKKLAHKIRGVKEYADGILDHPECCANAAITKYRFSKRTGNALSIDEMKALASTLARKTANRFEGVGGNDQIAVPRRGAQIELYQQNLRQLLIRRL